MAVAGASHKSPEQIEDLKKNQRQNGATSFPNPCVFLLRGVYKPRPAGPLAACATLHAGGLSDTARAHAWSSPRVLASSEGQAAG